MPNGLCYVLLVFLNSCKLEFSTSCFSQHINKSLLILFKITSVKTTLCTDLLLQHGVHNLLSDCWCP